MSRTARAPSFLRQPPLARPPAATRRSVITQALAAMIGDLRTGVHPARTWRARPPHRPGRGGQAEGTHARDETRACYAAVHRGYGNGAVRSGRRGEAAMWAGHQGRTVGRWAALGLLGGVLALLGACSSGGTPPAADSTTSAGRPVAAAAAPGSGPPARTRIQYGMVSRNVHNWPIFVAEQQGFFEHEGLEVETTQTGASVRAVQFVASGSLDVVSASADAVILGHDRGAPVVIVGGVNRAVYSLVAQPHIRAYSALRGATLGVSALKGGETTHLRKLLQARGLQESDYHLVVGGGTAERYIAFRSGAFDAAMLPSPEDVQLRQDGYPILGSSKEVLPHFPFLTMAARQDWAAAN